MKIYKIKNLYWLRKYCKILSINQPEISNEINNYLLTIKKISKSMNIYNSENELYETEIYFGKAKTKIIWNIGTAEKIISENKIKAIKYETNKINLNNAQIKKTKINNIIKQHNENKPIILAKITKNQQPFLIDGTHRLYIKKTNNEKFINAYILNIEETINALLCKEYKTLFKIFHNLIIINELTNKNTIITNKNNELYKI